MITLRFQFSVTNPDWSDSLRWALAIITAVLFFGAIVAHELSHALVAKARGLPVRSITLFALGGVAQIEKEAADAKTEFWMGIIGPITSFVIGFACLAITIALGWRPSEFPHVSRLRDRGRTLERADFRRGESIAPQLPPEIVDEPLSVE